MMQIRIKRQPTAKLLYLLNVLHHYSFDFRDLGLHLRKPAYVLGMIHALLHLLLQFRPIMLEGKRSSTNKKIRWLIALKKDKEIRKSCWNHPSLALERGDLPASRLNRNNIDG